MAKLSEVTLIVRNKTDEEWESSTDILKQGQLGIENNTGRMKLGNGKNLYRDLPYLYLTPSEVQKLDEELEERIKASAGITSITIDGEKLTGDISLGTLSKKDSVEEDDLDESLTATEAEVTEMLNDVFSSDEVGA